MLVGYGDQIRRYRIEQGLSQMELGQLIGTQQPNIANYETEMVRPDEITCEMLTEILGCENAIDTGLIYMDWHRIDGTHMPPEGTDVILLFEGDHDYYRIGKYQGGTWVWAEDANEGGVLTHWIRLPKKPRKGRKHW